MMELLHTLLEFLLIFGIIFCLNVIPVFAPPTWTALAYIAIRYHHNILLLALVGAVAATTGRIVLAKLSDTIVRRKFLSEGTKQNIGEIKTQLEKNRKLTFSIFLFYAFSPLPSNHLFIAYGLTGLSLKLIAMPFFLGRIVSYWFWAFSASSVATLLASQKIGSGSFFSVYFIVTQLSTIFLVYLFTKIDWRALFREKKLRWRKKEPSTLKHNIEGESQ
jgi:hypothetical protein